MSPSPKIVIPPAQSITLGTSSSIGSVSVGGVSSVPFLGAPLPVATPIMTDELKSNGERKTQKTS
eukprot:CAMPEP_0173411266 /NCGR_PEP_ID=MMETSP1356-20130122/76530_1 /TAXON_ID=77927 ORGANISM="Hemiselmis virescens, Strain PCC157" /NCGR_SAMPLE_ID=MMETSP1356 /ASSEMBLY_ACC=CAM_ASM_000847 /LENGTH=64 /DNA_ID=CAMNT_0014373007 /DNA_START=160 /DNA_END=354 /DNA_ORIENTATION=-